MLRCVAVILCAILFVGAVLAGHYPDSYYKDPPAPGLFGPYTCGNGACLIRVPNPDSGTLEYIRSMDRHLTSQFGRNRMVGDRFQVCNETHCATYTRRDGIHEFGGSDVVQVEIPGAGGAGGGGGQETGENGGGYNPGAGGGGGGGGGGTGKVIVNEPVVVEN